VIEISFFVPGHPKPQGSKRGFNRGGKVVMVESCAALHDWRSAVSYHAAKVRPEKLIEGPVRMNIIFSLPRPRSHYRTGAHLNELRASAPQYPIGHQTGDLDKLTRTMFDALTGVIYVDDSQVVVADIRKGYGTPGVEIKIKEMRHD